MRQKHASEISQRAQRAAESILENENLTADLEDAAARLLSDWGMTWAKAVASQTAGLNADEAEQALASGLHATRQLMRSVSRWATSQPDRQTDLELLGQMVIQMQTIYGESFIPPGENLQQAFLEEDLQEFVDPSLRISLLRNLFES